MKIAVNYQTPATIETLSALEKALAIQIPENCKSDLCVLSAASLSDNIHSEFEQVNRPGYRGGCLV
jgi:hypothetical protein